MKIRHLTHGLFTALLVVFLLGAGNTHAQLADEPLVHLSDAEAQRLRQVLDTPIDPNTFNLNKTALFRQKKLAALRLGDMAAMERYGREWALVDPVEGKWALMIALAGTEKRAEAYVLGRQAVEANRWPPNSVRIKVKMAEYHLQDNQLQDAKRLLDEAEKILRFEFRQLPRQGGALLSIANAEMDLLDVKSNYLRRTGRWAEGIEGSKLAVAKGKEVLSLANNAPDEFLRYTSQAGVLWAMSELSTHQLAAGLYSDAEWTLRDTFKLAKEQAFQEKMLMGVNNRVADLYNATGQYKDAQLFARRSEQNVLSAGFQKGSPRWVFTQMRVSQALAGLDAWPQALAKLDELDAQVARVKTPAGLANQVALRAYIYLKNGREVDALRVLRAGLTSRVNNFGENHYLTASIRGLMAVALWQNKLLPEARTEFDSASRYMVSPDSLTGNFVENAFEKKTRHYILQSYMQLLAKTAATEPKDAEMLFQVADQLNASSVQQAVSDAAVRAGVTVPGLSEIIRKEQDAKNEMATLTGYITGQGGEDDKRRNAAVVDQMRARMRELELARKDYKAQINKSYPDYFQLIQPKSPSPSDIARQLKPDELFVSMLPMEEQTYLWAIDAAGQVSFHIANKGEKQTHAAIEKIRKTLDVAHLGERAPAFDYAASHQLYQQLLSPFEAALVGKKHLVVATSGALANLPLAVLTRAVFSGRDAAQAPWLVKDVAVSHVPTANGWLALKQLGKTASSDQPLMAWGDPAFDVKPQAQVALLEPTAPTSVLRSVATLRSADLTPRNVLDPDTYVNYRKLPALPETRDEVLALAKILSANPVQDVILGAQATRASVLKSSSSGQLGRKQVVVFATHGLLAGDLPSLNQPALAMASTADPADSPLLTLEDVLTLKLNADWVVLSACNTAGADGRAGEALTGLARGFFYAGSRSLLVTHWAVESESAMMLTTKTFAAYTSDPGIRRAEALRQAMLETMKLARYAHPAYWAPYALVGEGGR